MAITFGPIQFSAVSAHFSALQHMLITAQPLHGEPFTALWLSLQRLETGSVTRHYAITVTVDSAVAGNWRVALPAPPPAPHPHPHSALSARLANLQTRRVTPGHFLLAAPHHSLPPDSASLHRTRAPFLYIQAISIFHRQNQKAPKNHRNSNVAS